MDEIKRILGKRFEKPGDSSSRIVRVRFATPQSLTKFASKLTSLARTVRACEERRTRHYSEALEERWSSVWNEAGMPQYVNIKDRVVALLDFWIDPSDASVAAWEETLESKLWQTDGDTVNSLPYPPQKRRNIVGLAFTASRRVQPRYPIYIISKGRAESRYTSRALERMRVPYHIVVEPQEFAQYTAVIDSSKVLKLPFGNLGKGSIPARNWVKKHAAEKGHARHWILDDNITHFWRRNHGRKIRCVTANIFSAAEDFVDRYENVPMAGFHYQQFVPDKRQIAPVILNTRVYSCILLQSDIPFAWRGKYNEDTDLSLRLLKKGFSTIVFNAFLISKTPTMKLAGGNTTEVYDGGSKRKEFAESLQRQHPDVVKVVTKFGRFHHQVDYSPYKQNALIRKRRISAPRKYYMSDEPVAIA